MSHSRRVVLAATAFSLVGSANAQTNDAAQFAPILEAYGAALRANDVEALVALFAPNGVFMGQNMPAAVGSAALHAAYQKVFATLKVDVHFTIEEAEMKGDMAWLRSTSKGRITTLASGAATDGSFNCLFVFRRDGGTWKIRNYLYASNKLGTATLQ